MKKAISLILFIFISFLAFPQEVDLQKIDQSDLSSYIHQLASPEFEGRKTGTSGEERAANYIADTFGKLQLQPIDDSDYFQPFILKKRYVAESYIKTNKETFSYFGEYVATNITNIPHDAEKTIVFGGNGTPHELDKISVEGNVVLVFHKSLRNTMQLTKELSARKAFALIVATPDDDTRFAYHKRTSSYLLNQKIYSEQRDSLQLPFSMIPSIDLPEFAVSNAIVPSLMGISISKLKMYARSGNIQEAPTQTIRLCHRKVTEDFTAKNVVGMLKGELPQAIVISAHYDHLGTRDDVYFPGADDNTSGTAALLELAEAFSSQKNLRYTLIFLAVAAEESGLWGSRHFVHHSIPIISDSIFLNINMDMISRNDEQTKSKKKNLFYFTAKGIDNEILHLFQKADTIFTHTDMVYNDENVTEYFSSSDQQNFYAQGIPAIFIFSGLHADYHRPSDTPDKIDYEKLTERVRLIARAIDLIQKEYKIE